MSMHLKHSIPLDDHRLLLNGLQPDRRSGRRHLDGSGRSAKRQRTDGMNSHYDRMIQTVNVLHATSTSAARPRRQRAASSSSTTTYDAPPTPVDASTAFDRGALGEDFSVLKMDGPRSSVKGHDPFDRSAFDEDPPALDVTNHLPPWLRNTITTLGSKHPLRLLLPTAPSSRPVPDQDPDITSQPAVEASPFAFIPPEGSEEATVPEIWPHDLTPQPLEPPWNYVKEPLVIREVSPVSLAQLEDRMPTPGPSGRLELPFSTAGPASTFSAIVDPTPARALPTTPSIYAIPAFIDPYTAQMPVPFSTPGPACLTGNPPLVVSGTDLVPLSPACVSTVGLNRPSPYLSPLQAAPPFSTPGPTLAVHADFRHPSPQQLPLPLYAEDRFQEPSHAFGHARWMNIASRIISPTPSPASGPAQRFLAELSRSHELAPSPYCLENEDGTTPPELQVDYETLGFKWKKFDRGDIVLDASSSSPPPADSNSEEVFWSQPRAPTSHIPNADALELTRPPEAVLQSSSASLRLTGISTPDLEGSRVHHHGDTEPRTPSPHAQEPHNSQQSEGGGLSAWTMTHRDGPALSTPHSLTKSAYSNEEPWAEKGRWPRYDDAQDGPRGDDDLDEGEPETSAPPKMPFAPAPGIYVSPLRGAEDDDGEGESVGDSGLPPRDNVRAVSHARETLLNYSSDGSIRKGTMRAGLSSKKLSRGPHLTTNEESAVEDISQSTSRSGHRASVRSSSEVDDIEADESARSSQESRDTIESWTD
ncbi:hypothetical protein L226DRAFT_610053 [Lentinus tigrinus ALCF2SS1-7]|uniref:uncharacterized protein n=1 Tax=Lentinus tigrinus ALCF2SS1-7 TaxID=1328758 RepID=UPI0011661E71|nr:hypothetical protein L226DRAFT_610053 [Lentinus tigrinus ALCF2SS1-7]